MPVGAQQFSVLQVGMLCQGLADVAIPAGTNTTVLTINGASGTVTATSNDTWSPNLDVTLALLLGATAPTQINVDYGLVLGTAIDSYTVPPALLVANATILVGVTLIGPASKFTWLSAQTPQVYVIATGQAITAKFIGSRAIFSLYMGGP